MPNPVLLTAQAAEQQGELRQEDGEGAGGQQSGDNEGSREALLRWGSEPAPDTPTLQQRSPASPSAAQGLLLSPLPPPMCQEMAWVGIGCLRQEPGQANPARLPQCPTQDVRVLWVLGQQQQPWLSTPFLLLGRN